MAAIKFIYIDILLAFLCVPLKSHTGVAIGTNNEDWFQK